MTNELVNAARNGFFAWMAGSYMDLKEFGPKGVKLWQKRMDEGLKNAYRKMGAEEGGGFEEFLQYVVARDKLLGIRANCTIMDGRLTYNIDTKTPFISIWNQLTEEDYKNITLDGFIETKKQFFIPASDVIQTKNMFHGDKVDEYVFHW